MPVLYRASFGYLLRHPWQLGLALLGICAGVAVMVAIDLANTSSKKAFFLSMDAINGKATHQIVAGPRGIDESLYTNLRVEDGIRNVAPVVSGYVQIKGETLQLLGIDIFAESEFRSYSSTENIEDDLTSSPVNSHQSSPQSMVRAFLTTPGAVFMTASNAQRFDLDVSESFGITVNGHSQAATLAGTIDVQENAALQGLIIADIATVQRWLDMGGRLTRIDVRSNGTEMLEIIRARLPADASLLTASGRSETTLAMSNAFTTNLSAMSLLALLVGVFLIYNSVTFAVLQRRGLLGVLRALGVSRGRVFALIMFESLLLGAFGAVLGIFCGTILGGQLVSLVSQTINDHFFVVQVTDVAVSALTVAKGLLAGLGATAIAAAIPAIEASTVPPRLALVRSAIETTAGKAVSMLAIAGMFLLGLAVLVLQLSDNDLRWGLAGVFLVIFAYSLFIPAGVRLFSALLEPIVRQVAGTTFRMAAGGITASLSRTGVAIVALTIAVSTSIGVSIMINSFRDSVATWLDTSLQSDIYVGVPRGSLDRELLLELVALPEIEYYSTSRRVWLETADNRIRLIAMQMAPGSYSGFQLRSEDPDAAWAQFVQDDVVLVSDPYAYKNQVAGGDTVSLTTRQGEKTFRIAAVYQSYDSSDGTVLIRRELYDQYFDDPDVDAVGLYLAAGVSAESVMEQLRETSAGRQSLLINSNVRIREMSLRIFDRTFIITNVLYWLAVGVAIIGILGAMLAMQLERAREFGVLRAAGMTPWQVGRLITGQSSLLGLISGIAAIPLGITMAVLLIEVINRRAFGWQMDVNVSASGLAAALLLAVGAATLASVYPALRAANAPPALAMREE